MCARRKSATGCLLFPACRRLSCSSIRSLSSSSWLKARTEPARVYGIRKSSVETISGVASNATWRTLPRTPIWITLRPSSRNVDTETSDGARDIWLLGIKRFRESTKFGADPMQSDGRGPAQPHDFPCTLDHLLVLDGQRLEVPRQALQAGIAARKLVTQRGHFSRLPCPFSRILPARLSRRINGPILRKTLDLRGRSRVSRLSPTGAGATPAIRPVPAGPAGPGAVATGSCRQSPATGPVFP